MGFDTFVRRMQAEQGKPDDLIDATRDSLITRSAEMSLAVVYVHTIQVDSTRQPLTRWEPSHCPAYSLGRVVDLEHVVGQRKGM